MTLIAHGPDLATSQARAVHPFVYLILVLPFGALSGFLTTAVAYELSQAGLSVEQVAGLIAFSFLPHTWKFLWAPVADATFTRKGWYRSMAVVSGLGFFATAAIPATEAALPWMYLVVGVSNIAITLLVMSIESLMAHDSPPEQRGRVAGWFQAGNMIGGGIGGGLGLWLTQVLPDAWMAGAALAVGTVLCSFALKPLREPPPMASATGRPLRDMLEALRDLWQVLRTRAGWLAALICLMPLGTGAAMGLAAAVAGDWHASAATVATVTGVLSGLVAALGCWVAGPLCDRMDRKTAYLLFGLTQSACALAMALAPRTETMFIVFSLIYSFTGGLAYTAYTAVVLEVIEGGAAATKYTMLSSLANTPIAYMIMIDGWAHGRWGAGGMLYTEAALSTLGAVVFALVAAVAAGKNRRRLAAA